MTSERWLTDQFEDSRTHLKAVAYRMLGSLAEADDAVQEAWLRVSRADTAGVENMRGWLTTVVSRICLDMLRERRARREEHGDSWLEEPIMSLDDPADPEHEVLMADSVGLALVVILGTLSPAERLAFVLHDLFGMPFEEIAPIVERNTAATRQLASRARRRVRGAEPEPTAETLAMQRKVVDAFLQASREGNFDALLEVLDPDVVFRADRGVAGAPGPVEYHGAKTVATAVLQRGSRFAPHGRPAIIDGRPGLFVRIDGHLISVLRFTVEGDRVTAMDLVLDQRKLRQPRV